MQRWIEFLAFVGIMLGIAMLSYAGFCFTTFRFLPDDEAIDAAIDEIRASKLHTVENPSGGYIRLSPEKQVVYGSRDEFRRLNPDCCKIVPHDRLWIGFWHQLFGKAAKSVRINYMVRYTNEFGGVSQMEAVAERAIGNCGHVLNLGH